MTAQQKMAATLAKTGIAHKRIHCYGSQIVITSHCRATADKWASVLAKFAKVSAVIESMENAVENHKTCLNPSMVKVWRTFATI